MANNENDVITIHLHDLGKSSMPREKTIDVPVASCATLNNVVVEKEEGGESNG